MKLEKVAGEASGFPRPFLWITDPSIPDASRQACQSLPLRSRAMTAITCDHGDFYWLAPAIFIGVLAKYQ